MRFRLLLFFLVCIFISTLLPQQLFAFSDLNNSPGYVDEKPKIDKQLSVFQVWPDPYSSVTKVKYHLPSACKVKLCVKDILGNEVKLVDAYKLAGLHEVEFEINGGIAGSVYFCELSVGEVCKTKKVILLR